MDIKNLIYYILSIQEKFLRLRLSKTLNAKNSSKNKRHYTNGCFLDLSSLAEIEKQKFEEELAFLLEKSNYEPENLLRYIEVQGTTVIRIDNASSILNSIGENEGFIYPTQGMRAMYLSLAFLKRCQFKTSAMFILNRGEINKYYFIYHFYNWFAFQKNINGLDSESQTLLRKFLFEDNDVKTLQLSEIYKLKDAIKQDKASIEFVIKLCRNYEGAKQALSKLKTNGANI